MISKHLPISRSELRQIENLLKLFDCNQREASIYVQALMMGPSTIQDVANALGQNRVTVHNAVGQIIRKGFLYETRKGKKRLLVAEEPVVLHRILQKRENELKVLKDNAYELSSLLASLQGVSPGVPTVKFYEGSDGFRNMLEDTLSTRDEVLVITYVDLFARSLSADYLEDYFKRRAEKGIHTRLIYPVSNFGARIAKKSSVYKIQVRILEEVPEWRAGAFSWDDSLGIQSLTEGRLTCTIIQNKDIAHFWRQVIFPLLWNAAKPITAFGTKRHHSAPND